MKVKNLQRINQKRQQFLVVMKILKKNVGANLKIGQTEYPLIAYIALDEYTNLTYLEYCVKVPLNPSILTYDDSVEWILATICIYPSRLNLKQIADSQSVNNIEQVELFKEKSELNEFQKSLAEINEYKLRSNIENIDFSNPKSISLRILLYTCTVIWVIVKLMLFWVPFVNRVWTNLGLPKLVVIELALKKWEIMKSVGKYAGYLAEEKPNTEKGTKEYYIKLWTWLEFCTLLTQIAFDIVLGISFFLVFIMYPNFFISKIKLIMSWTEIDILKYQVNWLMSILTEFRPNVYLDIFLGNLLLELLNFWNMITTYLNQYELTMIQYMIAPFGALGISFQFAMMHDFLWLITVHFHVVYNIFAMAHSLWLQVLLNCTYMFRSKKYNVISEKVDDHTYSAIEFFLGVLIFTVVSLTLLSTLSIYYISLIYLMWIITVFEVILVLGVKASYQVPLFLSLWIGSHPYVFSKGIEIDQVKIKPIKMSTSISYEALGKDLNRTLSNINLGQLLKRFSQGKPVYKILQDIRQL